MTLTEQEQEQVERRVRNSGKSVNLCYFLWLFIGFFGTHRFYTKKNTLGGITLALCMVSLATIFTPVQTQMPEYVQCMQSAVRNDVPIDERKCEPQLDQLTATDKTVMLFGVGILFVLALWWVFDAFSIPRTVSKNNQQLRQKFQEEILKQRPPEK